jgi:hypothetical protein
MLLYKKLKNFPLYNEIREKTISFIKQYDFIYNRSIATLMPLQQFEIFEKVPEIKQAFNQIGLNPVFAAVHTMRLQEDSAPHHDRVQPLVRINIPLINCETSETIFYEDYEKSKIFINPHNGTTAYIMEDESVLTKVDSVVLDYATILRVSALHSVRIGSGSPRISLTVGFDYDGLDLLEENKLNYFRSINLCD